MRTPTETVQTFVDAFVAAWPVGDADAVARFFDEDAVYQNGPLPKLRGRDAIRDELARFMALGGEVAVDIRHLVAEGELVMSERVDRFVLDGRTISLPVMGAFEVRDGVITAWRDYFDLAQFTAQLADGTTAP
ncbi:MAG TPA: limonene-1,2-epoxide hydrolase family protein [Mycobacteriales bacterium]|nr:limonene-1,2-epoxide hydrolase family protein [Mycobacteriales bacterium]